MRGVINKMKIWKIQFVKILVLKVSTVEIEIMRSEIEFKEFEPGQDFTKPPTGGSDLNHRFKSFFNLKHLNQVN